jgi:PQQ-dependent dehydrogenase (methanol/ethanol family)
MKLAALAGLCLTPILLAQNNVPDAVKNPLEGNPAAIDAGRQLYTSVCQACHGPEARGERGPALTGSLRHGNSDTEMFRNVRGGIQGTQMPPFAQFTADQIWQVIAYIRGLSGASNSAAAPGDAAAGRMIFDGKGQCRTCHQADLGGAGLMTAQQLRSAIVNPGHRPVVIVKTKDGHEYRGLRRDDDTFSLQMQDASGQLRSFQKSALASIGVDATSIMPTDYAKRLTSTEIQNVVAYLKTLTVSAIPPGGLTYDRIRNGTAEPQNWLTYWGDYAGHHYSSLAQINWTNVNNIQARWAVQMPGDGTLESTPLVGDGVMYTSGPAGQVYALDAATGRQIWRFERKQKTVNPYEANRFNRGVAVLNGRVFVGTLDAALVALDARSGALLWEVQVADTMLGYSLTSAPLALKDKIVTGISGGEYGIVGFLEAYDPATGKKLWHINSIPVPGEPGNQTWAGDSWKHGSGGMWLTGSYDPALNTLYWAVGNPGPDINGDVRKGDNLYTCSVLAIDADTGKIKWHYQFTPHDTRDWDATEDLVLVDRMWHGQYRKLLMQADRNGNFYVIDRLNGQFLAAAPFMRTNWVKGWDSTGKPITIPAADANADGVWVYPSLNGGTNFQAPSYSPLTGWLYFAYHDGGQRFAIGPAPFEPGKQFQGEGGGSSSGPPAGDAPESQGIAAFDPETMKVAWKFPVTEASLTAGVLATGGGVVFASSHDGNFIALDAKTGKALWHFGTGGNVAGSPMSYSIDGKQYVAVSSAQVLYSFALPN